MKFAIAVIASLLLVSRTAGDCAVPNLKDRSAADELFPISGGASDVNIPQGRATIGYQTMYHTGGSCNEDQKSGSLVVRKLSQRSGAFQDQGPGWPALAVLNYMNVANEIALRVFGRKSGAASIGSDEGECEIDAFVAPKSPSLFVCKGGSGGAKFNGNGSRNSPTGNIQRTAIESRGAIRVCGKSSKNDNECTNSWYLYAADGKKGVYAKVVYGGDEEVINITGDLKDLKDRVDALEAPVRCMLRTSGGEQEEEDIQAQLNDLQEIVEAQQTQIAAQQAQIAALAVMIEKAGLGQEPMAA